MGARQSDQALADGGLVALARPSDAVGSRGEAPRFAENAEDAIIVTPAPAPPPPAPSGKAMLARAPSPAKAAGEDTTSSLLAAKRPERKRRNTRHAALVYEQRRNFPKGEVFAFPSHTALFMKKMEALGLEASAEDLEYQAQNDARLRHVFDSASRTVRRNPRNWVELFLLFSLRAQEVVAREDHHREVYADLDRLVTYILDSGRLSQFREALHSERLCVPEVVESKAPHFDEVLPDGTRLVYIAPGLEAVREELRSQMNFTYILQPIRDGHGSAHDKVILQNIWKLNRVSKTLFIPWTDIVNEYW